MTEETTIEGQAEGTDDAPRLTVTDLIFDLADTAKTVAKDYGMPINSAVEIVRLGVEYAMSYASLKPPTPELDLSDPDVADKIIELTFPENENGDNA